VEDRACGRVAQRATVPCRRQKRIETIVPLFAATDMTKV
jgi:hypothetical protein